MNEKEKQKEIQSLYVDVKVRIPRQVYEFFKAIHRFAKMPEPLEILLGYQITSALDADLHENLTPLLDLKEIVEGYGLNQAPVNFKPDC